MIPISGASSAEPEGRRLSAAGFEKTMPPGSDLAEVIDRYGGKVHLMVEVKQEPYADPGRQNRILGDLFAALRPGEDSTF